MTSAMTCEHLRTLLSEYVDGALPPAEAAAVEVALTGCPDCQREVARMRQTLALLDEAATVSLPPGFEAGFTQRLATAERSRASRRGFIGVAVAMAAAVVAFLLWPGADPVPEPPPDALIAQLDLLENYEVIEQLDSLLAAESLDDVDVIAALDELDGEAQ